MTQRRTCLTIALAAVVAVALSTSAAANPVRAWGTCSASECDDPAYPGMWEYELDFGWNLTGWGPAPLRQVVLFLDLEECPCAGEPQYFLFPFRQGSSGNQLIGETSYFYAGSFVLDGVAPFSEFGSALSFAYADLGAAFEAEGTATIVFLSKACPMPSVTYPGYLGIVAGTSRATGDVTGSLPSCDCGLSPAESVTWGAIKGIFR